MVTATVTLHNLGDLSAVPHTLAYYITLSDGSDIYVGSRLVTGVDAGGSVDVPFVWDSTSYTGPITLTAVIDPYDRLPEVNEDNNQAFVGLTMLTRPDLTVSAIVPASSPRLTLPTDIAVTTLNQGETDAALHTLSLYAGDPAAGGVLIGSQAISVTAGLSVTTVFSWTPPAPGSVDLVAVADSGHAVNEYDEANNSYTAAVYVGWGDPVTIDAGAATDLPYDANVGYGYVNAGTPFSCGPDPIHTGRQGQSGLPLEYRFDHLLPDRFYHLDLIVRPCNLNRQQRIRVDGVEMFPAHTFVPGEEYHISLLLNPADYATDHSIIVSLEKSGGTYPPAINLLTLTDIRYCYRDSGSPAEVGYAGAADGCGFLDGDISGSPGDPVQSVRYDLDNDVQYQFDNLVASDTYLVGVTLFDQDNLGLQEHLEADGTPVGPVIALNDTPQYVVAEMPANTYSDGQVVVAIVEPINGGPLVSEIWLEQVTDFTGPVIPPTPTPNPTGTPTPSPAPTDTPTPTLTPLPTDTPTPTIPPTPTNTPTPPPIVVDDRDYGIQYDGWYGGQDATALGGGYRAATQTSQYLAYRATQPSTSVILRVCKGPNLGIANVMIDGAAKPALDLYNPNPACNVPVQYTGLTNSQHLILFLPSGQKNAASSGTEVRLDAFQVGLTLTDDSHPSVIYTHWSGLTLAPAYQGTLRLSQTATANVSFNVSGTAFSWLTAHCPICGQALVIVDGSPAALVDTYAASWQFQIPESIIGLPDGSHTVTIRVLGTHNPNSSGNIVFFDGFTVP